MSHVPYASTVGSIMYVMVCTRLEISHAVSVVSRYMDHPEKIHWQAVKWILRHLRGTSHVGLVYDKNFDISRGIVGYVDFDYVGDLDRRRSLTRYVFTLCGNVISWKATLQSTIALSTIEAKCMIVTEAVKAVIWLKGLVSRFRLITGVDCCVL